MIRLSLRQEPPLRIAADGLIPQRLAGRSSGEIERLPLRLGNSRAAVGDWFRVAGGGGGAIEIEGPCRRLDRIGAGMDSGSLTVRGDAGAYLGLGMSGGTLAVEGSADFGAATDLRGGTLRIGGNAADGLGGALPGAAAGMRQGVVIVAGDAGASAGAHLRRGLIVILGSAGAAGGAGMLAGTLVVGGTLGPHAGAAMHRGSIIVLGGAAGIGPGFLDCGVHDLVIIALLKRQLAGLGLAALAARLGPLRRFAGDAAVGGRGELLIGR